MYFANNKVKQTAAILLIMIFSFNIFGYRILYTYLANKADTRLELALDIEAYDDADLISIKQATNLPYYNNSKTFERLNGEVNINGTIYKYVKCRIYNDSLEMLCIPHIAKMQIQNSKQVFFKLTNDLQQDKKKSSPEQKQAKSMLSEYEEIQNIPYNESCIILTTSFFNKNATLPQIFIKTSERPPDTFLYSLPV